MFWWPLALLGLPTQSGVGETPSDITTVVSDAVGNVPSAVIILLIVMIVSGVIVLLLKARGGYDEED